MKFTYTTLLSLLLCLPTLVVAQAPDLESMDIVTKSIPDGPVARVGKVNIEKFDYVLLYRSELNRFSQENSTVPLDDAARVNIGIHSMNILVEQELLYQEAKRNEITASLAEVNKQADAQYKRLQKGFSQTAGREVTEEEILKRLGYTKRTEINDEIERALIISSMRKKILSDHKKSITTVKLEEVYEKNKANFTKPAGYRLRQIYVKAETEDKTVRAVAKKKADAALGRLFSGQRFGTVAEEVSDAPDAKKGGDMGYLPTQQVLPFMVEALKDMQADDISDVLESKYGYHIIQLIEKTAAEAVPKEKALEIIRVQLAGRQATMVVRQYCDRLIAGKAPVTIFLELEKNLARINGDSSN